MSITCFVKCLEAASFSYVGKCSDGAGEAVDRLVQAAARSVYCEHLSLSQVESSLDPERGRVGCWPADGCGHRASCTGWDDVPAAGMYLPSFEQDVFCLARAQLLLHLVCAPKDKKKKKLQQADPQIKYRPKYGPACHQTYHPDVTALVTLVRLLPHW